MDGEGPRRPTAPDPELLLPHGDLVPALGHDMPEQLGQGILPVHSKHPTFDRSSNPIGRARRFATPVESLLSKGAS